MARSGRHRPPAVIPPKRRRPAYLSTRLTISVPDPEAASPASRFRRDQKIGAAGNDFVAPAAPARARRRTERVLVRFADFDCFAAGKEPSAPDQRRIAVPDHVESPGAKDIAKARVVDDRAAEP
jgi:hypothetical protein